MLISCPQTSEFMIRSIWLQILGNSDYQAFWKFWHANIFPLPSLEILDRFPSIKTIPSSRHVKRDPEK